MTLLQAPFVDRDNFGGFLNSRHLTNMAVEVGTHRGAFAYQLLRQWEGKILHCVDPWMNPLGYGPQVPHLDGGGRDRGLDHAIAKRNLKEFGQRVRLRVATSNKAVLDYPPESLDFVYIDGDHRYQMVAEDLSMWWPKVKPGGILAGHDFLAHGEDVPMLRGVQEAVMEFASHRNLDVYMVVESISMPWSFYFMKPE